MRVRRAFATLLWIGSVLLSACGGGDSPAPAGPPPSPPAAPTVTLNYGIKQLQFSWAAVSGATHYRLLERPDAAAAFAQVGTNVTVTSVNHDIALHQRVNAAYRIEACNSVGCTASSNVSLAANLLPAIGYFKASNAEGGDRFGVAVALSADGSTLAVGASGEDSNATGVNGAQSNNSAINAGAVYVFTRSAGGWAQQAYIKASNAAFNDGFGETIALSADGSTLAVGATTESSSATGVNGNEADNSAQDSGAVYVFVRSAGAWTQQAYVKASNTGAADMFGSAIALSATGDTLAVGAANEDSSTTGVNGNQTDNSAANAGAVYVFTRTGDVWSQQAYLKASNTNFTDRFGVAVALSADGSTLAVGASGEGSNATGINGDQLNTLAANSGAVYIFTLATGTWTQQAYIKESNTEALDSFGSAVALSADGSTLVVGAIGEDSNASGVNGAQSDNSAANAGAVYVFTRNAGVWAQQAYIKASNAAGGDTFGALVALSADGSTLAVGATGEDSNAAGVNGAQSDNSAANAGAVYVFRRNAGVWAQQAYIKASNPEAIDLFGSALALSADGATLAIWGALESSSATGIGGDQANNLAVSSGAVYLY